MPDSYEYLAAVSTWTLITMLEMNEEFFADNHEEGAKAFEYLNQAQNYSEQDNHQAAYTHIMEFFASILRQYPEIITNHSKIEEAIVHIRKTAAEMSQSERSTPYLRVGETDGKYIGCYLFGIEGPSSNPSYHSVATTKEELIDDCRTFFTELTQKKRELVKSSLHGARHEQDLKIIINFLNNLEMFVSMHLKSGIEEPLLKFSWAQIFLRTGVRERQMLRGKYIE